MVVDDDPDLLEVCGAILSDAGYRVVLCNSDDDPKIEREYLDLLEGMRIDALIVTPTSKNRRRLADLMAKDIVVVQVDRRVEGLQADAVLVDNESGSMAAVEHMIEAGHTRIGILTGDLDVPTASQRLAGYERALREHGITVSPSLVKSGSFHREHAIGARRGQQVGHQASRDGNTWLVFLVAAGVGKVRNYGRYPLGRGVLERVQRDQQLDHVL